MLKIFNTLTQKKEEFKPIYNGKVNIYVCGITVYDLCHIGHARTFTFFDIVVRYLCYLGFKVNYIRNITDIEDKIIKKSIINCEPFYKLTDRMIKEMHYDLDKLDIIRPTYEPKATDYIHTINKMIHSLLMKKYAYISNNGDIMFSVKRNINYGILSRQNLNKLRSKNNGKNKINSMDFVLWKMAKPNEPSWESKWGNGRPGWHIECSAIIQSQFGDCFDIHGGGSDLIFPHHENELAQSTSFYDKETYANFWMHTGMVLINNKKVSKSKDNYFPLKHILKLHNPEVLRFFLLSSHYRKQLNYNENDLKKSYLSLKKMYAVLRDSNISINTPPYGGDTFINQFKDAMNDDFNTPRAYYVLFKIVNEINCLINKKKIKEAQGMSSTLRELGGILGLLKQDPISFLQRNDNKLYEEDEEINSLIKERDIARNSHLWKIADEIRNKLNKNGIILEDTSCGTRWYRRY